jgi:hypothetical protein
LVKNNVQLRNYEVTLKQKLLRQSVHLMLQARMYYVDNLGDYREFGKQELILTENLQAVCTLL